MCNCVSCLSSRNSCGNNSCGCSLSCSLGTNTANTSNGTTNSNVLSAATGNTTSNTNNQSQNTLSMNDVLESLIGRRCRCEFALGDNLVKKTGVLTEVGSDYIKLTSTNNCADSLICNICSLIFVRVD